MFKLPTTQNKQNKGGNCIFFEAAETAKSIQSTLEERILRMRIVPLKKYDQCGSKNCCFRQFIKENASFERYSIDRWLKDQPNTPWSLDRSISARTNWRITSEGMLTSMVAAFLNKHKIRPHSWIHEEKKNAIVRNENNAQENLTLSWQNNQKMIFSIWYND